MSRNGKIDASGPSKAINFLKKNIQIISSSLEQTVSLDIAKKACEKSRIEGRISGINDAISIIYELKQDRLEYKNIMTELSILKDRVTGLSV